MTRAALILICALATWPALAQDVPPQDEPRGAPYNTSIDSSVSLRDFTSARLDLIKVEIDKAIVAQREIIDERDKQYNQRFDAQQEAVAAALQAAKEAVQKAEDAANKRFDSVNEFRAQLADQAATFMSKAEADAKFEALGNQTRANTARMDAVAASDAGQYNLWAIIAGILVMLVAVIGLALNINNSNRARLEAQRLKP